MEEFDVYQYVTPFMRDYLDHEITWDEVQDYLIEEGVEWATSEDIWVLTEVLNKELESVARSY